MDLNRHNLQTSFQALQGTDEGDEAKYAPEEDSLEPSFSSSMLDETDDDFSVDVSDEPTFTSALQESSFSKSFAFSAQIQDSEPTFSTSLDENDDFDNERIALQESSFTKSFAFSAQFQESSPTFSTSIDDDEGDEEDEATVFSTATEVSDAPSFSATLEKEADDDDDAPVFASSIPELEGFGSFTAADDIDEEDSVNEATAPSFTASLQGSSAPSLTLSGGTDEGALSGVDEEARVRVEEVDAPLCLFGSFISRLPRESACVCTSYFILHALQLLWI